MLLFGLADSNNFYCSCERVFQPDLRNKPVDTVDREKQSALAKAVDAINRKHGHNTVRMSVQGFDKSWHLKNEYISR